MQAFLLFHPFLEKRAFFSHPFVFGGLFCTYDVRACFRRAFAIHCNASTEQRSSTESAQHKAAKQVRANQSATVQARGQTWLSQHVVEHSHSSLCFQNGRRDQNLPSLQKTQPLLNHPQSSLAGVIRQEIPFISNLIKIRHWSSVLYFVHACGVRVVFVDHGALGICKSLVCTYKA